MEKNEDVGLFYWKSRIKKMLLLMKLICFWILVGLMQVHATAYGQAESVAFEKKSLTIDQVFSTITTQLKYDIFYSDDEIDVAKVVRLPNLTVNVEDVLRLVLGEHFTYQFVGKTIVIAPKTEIPQNQKGLQLRGFVSDTKKRPMPGVTVKLVGTSIGTATNMDGWFQLPDIPANAGTLEFSFVGYKSQKVDFTANTRDTLRIVMEEDVTEVDEVVVTGMFTRKANSFTGAAQSFSREEIRRVGNTNVLQSIKNLDPSFRIAESLANGSNPNQQYEITMRGQSGFPDLKGEYSSNPNNPLFIVDGFEQSLTYVMDMDMNRVASVTLLKDAAAKAIYGSKAANGVVVIETLQPEKGKLRVSYTGTMNVQLPDLTSYDLCNAAEKLEVEFNAGKYTYFRDNGSSIWGNPVEQYSWDQVYNGLMKEVIAGVNTDWKSIPLRNGIGQKHTIYLEGGDDFFRYGLDVSYNNVVGVMKGSNRNTFSGGVTLSYRYNNIMLKNSFSVTYNKGENSPYGSFSEYTSMNPYYRCWDDDGNVIKILGERLGTYQNTNVYNPVWNATINTKDFSEYTQFVNNFYVEWTPARGFKFTGRVSLNKSDTGSEIFHPASHTNFIGWEEDEEKIYRRGSYIYGDGKSFAVSADVLANYSVQLGERHMIFANVGWSLNNSTSESVTFKAEGFSNDKLDNLAFARQHYKDGRPSASESTTRDIGFVGAANYSYDNRYLFDASFRLSGSSQFGSDNRWGTFWSLGLGWNLHQEKFFHSLTDSGILSQLKLRGSLGYTGSQNFNSYQSIATYSYYTSSAYNGNIGAVLAGMPNSRLKWQRKYDRNLGVDFGVFNGRLQGRFDYYSTVTDDLLTDVTIPSSTGFTSYKENLGKVENIGYEISLKYRVWQEQSKDAFLNIFVAASHNKNTIKQISNFLQTYNDTQTSSVSNKPITRYEEGQSMSAIWAVKSMGIDPACGDELFITSEGTRTYEWDSDNLQICGDTEPTLQGNLGFNFDYKGISLNVTARYQFGGQVYNQTLVDKVENANLENNVDRRIFSDRWVKKGDVSLYKNIKNEETTQATSRFVEDDDQFVISSLNLSYELTRIEAIKRIGMERLRLSFDMTDFGRMQSVKIERGTSYPFARTFSFSLQVMF